MIVEKRIVEVYEHLYCEFCNGEMSYIPELSPTEQYVHTCTHCGYRETMKHIYPRISSRYEEES